MAFTIPNNTDAFNLNQSRIFNTDLAAIVAGFAGEGVFTGCLVSNTGTLNVAVASGYAVCNTVWANVVAGNVAIATANTTLPRIDLIVANSSGSILGNTGSPATNPAPNQIPANTVLLAMVFVPAACTALDSTKIVDKRVMINGNSLYFITENVLTANATTVTFDNIPNCFRHLQFTLTGRTNASANAIYTNIRLNNDSSAIYATQKGAFSAGAASASEQTNGTSANVFVHTGGTANGFMVGSGTITLIDYANTNWFKSIRVESLYIQGTGTDGLSARMSAGAYRSTNPISRVDFSDLGIGSAFQTGSRFTLYGIK